MGASKTTCDANFLFGVQPVPLNEQDGMVDVKSVLSDGKITEQIEDCNLEDARLEKLMKILEGCIVSVAEASNGRTYYLRHGNIPFFQKRSICLVKGKAKHGKSWLIRILISALFGKSFGPIVAREKAKSILYFDTEQDRIDIAELSRSVNADVGWNLTQDNYDKFVPITLRTKDKDEKARLIEESISVYRPDIIIIDNIRDLTSNLNDPNEASTIASKLKVLCDTYDISIICTIHENKNKDDKSARGHLGTELVHAASDVLQIERMEVPVDNKKSGKDKQTIFVIEEFDCRGHENIPPFRFRVENGMPVCADSLVKQHEEAELEQLLKDIYDIARKQESVTIGKEILMRELASVRRKRDVPCGEKKVRDLIESLHGTWISEKQLGNSLLQNVQKIVERFNNNGNAA